MSRFVGGTENARVENAGATKYRKNSKEKNSKVPNEISTNLMNGAYDNNNSATDNAGSNRQYLRCVSWNCTTRIVLVLCRYWHFCESCANKLHNQECGYPLWHTPSNMLLHLYILLHQVHVNMNQRFSVKYHGDLAYLSHTFIARDVSFL